MTRNGPPAQNDEGAQLAIIQRRLVIVALTLLIAYLALQVAQTFSDVLRILSISVFLCYTASGLVDWLEGIVKSRLVAVLAVYTVGAIFTVLGIIVVIPTLVVQMSQFVQVTIDQLPTFVDWCSTLLDPLERKLVAAHIYMKPTEFLMSIASSLPKPDASVVMNQVSGVAMGTMTWVFYGLSILILTFYFLLDGYRMSYEIVEHFPGTYRKQLHDFLADSDKSLQNFFRGQIVLGFLFGAFMVLVYWAMGVQYALALGIILGLWEIVPVIGPTIGIIPAIVAVLLQGAEHVPGNRLV
ncbi:MAG TPA: AI-2E family transporter, partial [Nitrososphaera sp.]|nr:AI-2E family transporter [Nitrososphaera sp.]